MKISSVEQMRAMDRGAMESLGIPEALLMENAGQASFQILMRAFGGVAGKRFALFCGAGNNGGDGLVVARLILSGGGIPGCFSSAIPDASGGQPKSTWRSSRSFPSR